MILASENFATVYGLMKALENLTKASGRHPSEIYIKMNGILGMAVLVESELTDGSTVHDVTLKIPA